MIVSQGPLSRDTKRDAIASTMIAVLASFAALSAFIEYGSTQFYQKFAYESVIWACGHGMARLNEMPQELAAFLLGAASSFDCSTLPTSGFLEAGRFAALQPYFTWITALLWRVFGVSQMAIAPLVVALSALYGVGVYALSRLFLPRGMALLAAALLAVSPAATEMALSLRDYSKAPFFVLALLFITLALRGATTSARMVSATLAGTTAGIGYGFRLDLIVLLPIGIVALLVGQARCWRKPWRLIAPAGTFMATMLVTAGPVLVSHDLGSNGGTLAMQGASETMRSALGLSSASYSLAWTYSDELTLSEVAAAERPTISTWDETEMAHRPGYDLSGAITCSSGYLYGWAPMFAGDFITQGLKAAGWVVGFPAAYVRSAMPARTAVSKLMVPLYRLVGKAGLPILCALGFLVLLFRRFRENQPEAFALLVLFGLISGYTGIQFSMRHIFHLEFVWIIAMLSLPVLVRDAARATPNHALRSWRPFAAWVLAIGIATSGALIGFRHLQTSWLGSEVNRLVTGQNEPLSVVNAGQADGSVLISVPAPLQVTDIVNSADDSMTTAISLIGLQWDVRAAVDRLYITIGGSQCPKTAFALSLRYTHDDDVWQTLDSIMNVASTSEPGGYELLVPAFYRPTQSFSGLALPNTHARCDVSVKRLLAESRLPRVLSAQLRGSSLAGAASFGLGTFAVQRQQAGLMVKDHKIAAKVRSEQQARQ
jgi:hypothetical protein